MREGSRDKESVLRDNSSQIIQVKNYGTKEVGIADKGKGTLWKVNRADLSKNGWFRGRDLGLPLSRFPLQISLLSLWTRA